MDLVREDAVIDGKVPSDKISNDFASGQNKVKQDQILWLLDHSLTKNGQKTVKISKKSIFAKISHFFDFFCRNLGQKTIFENYFSCALKHNSFPSTLIKKGDKIFELC